MKKKLAGYIYQMTLSGKFVYTWTIARTLVWKYLIACLK